MMQQIILYGAGFRGSSILKSIEESNISYEVACFCDGKVQEGLTEFCGKPVLSYEDAKKKGLPFFIAVQQKPTQIELENKLKADQMEIILSEDVLFAELSKEERTKKSREYCANFHIEHMDDYFDGAENEDSLNKYWCDGENSGTISPFYEQFKKLDLENVIELACGRGRHVQKYMDKASRITLVDILEKNVQFCNSRFEGVGHISAAKTDGNNLKFLEDETYSSIFCYDAMVHFEMLDIYDYLYDIHRVLKTGASALFHHSNNHDPLATFARSLHGRAFMTQELFAHIAYRAGFELVSQEIIDWGTEESNDFVKHCDCITLLRKN